MRIFRIILSLLFLLAAVSVGVLAFIVATNEKLKSGAIELGRFLPKAALDAAPALDVSIKLVYLVGGAGIVLLLIAGMLWPPYQPRWRKAEEEKKRKKGKGVPAKASASSFLDAIPAAPAAPGSAHELPAVELEQLTEELDADEPQSQPQSQSQSDLDESELRELINREQQTIDGTVAADIIKRSYPAIAPLIPNFYDEASLVAAARQVIAALRFRVKLKDKALSSYQFSQFEERVYKTEAESILYRYSPRNKDALNDQQKAFAGKIFAQTSYREIQQNLLAEREDWERLSIKELH